MKELYKIQKINQVAQPKVNSTFGESKEWHFGYFVEQPKVGERFQLVGFNFQNEGIITSIVTRIIDDNMFETMNSVYKFEKAQ